MSYLMDFHRNVSFFTCICDALDFIRVSKGYTMSNRQQIKALYCAYTFIICKIILFGKTTITTELSASVQI